MEVGQHVEGRKGLYRLAEELKSGIAQSSRIFKAEVLHAPAAIQSQYVVIKAETPDSWVSKRGLRREYNAYQSPQIASSSAFRSMYDIIGDPQDFERDDTAIGGKPFPSLVLEWMDCTLQDTEPAQRDYVLLSAIFNAALSGLVVLGELGRIHCDLKPDNILLSGVGTENVQVKLGDLGLVRPEGFGGDTEPYAMRAPEVYQGLGCFHRSETWALAATIFCWLRPGVFGTPGNTSGFFDNESWCIGKLMKLFPEWIDAVPTGDDIMHTSFDIARLLTVEPDMDDKSAPMVKVATLEEEMKIAGFDPVVQDVFKSLFVIDRNKRPTAAEALALPQYLTLQQAALSQMKSQRKS